MVVKFISFEEYICFLVKNIKDYLIFIVSKDNIGRKLPQEYADLLFKLGVKTNLSAKSLNGKMWRGYVAIINCGELAYENIADDHKELRASYRGYKIYSTFYYNKQCKKAEVIKDNINYCPNKRGLNFIVFDKNGNFVNSSAIDCFEEKIVFYDITSKTTHFIELNKNKKGIGRTYFYGKEVLMKMILVLKRITPKWVKKLMKKIISTVNNFIEKHYFIKNGGEGGYIDCIEFYLTKKCNYKCEYCIGEFAPQKANANDETVESFIKLIPYLHKQATIKLIGGEPTMHPRFIDLAHCIMKYKHNLHIGTNFSLPNELFCRLIDCSERDNQIRLIVSLHLSQVKSIPDFINKLVSLKEYGNNRITINVVSVLLEEKFDLLKNVRENLMRYGINMNFQRLKINSNGVTKFCDYSEETERYLKEVFPKRKASKIVNLNPYGMLCKAGHSFVRIVTDGGVTRCYDSHPKLYNLGNINNEWRLLKNAMPCLSDKCTCLLPVDWGLLMFDNYNYKLADKLMRR